MSKEHRAGFVNIIGNPNVGKSTLMNALVGEKLCIVTAKAQTTRHRIMGIVNGEDFQIVYSDTPGILKPNYRLQKNMMNFVDGAIGDADIILYVTDTVEKPDKNGDYIEKLRALSCPVILVINKIDISDQPKVVELMAWWKERLPEALIIPASAQERFNLDSIFDAIVERLPVCLCFTKSEYLLSAKCISTKYKVIFNKLMPKAGKSNSIYQYSIIASQFIRVLKLISKCAFYWTNLFSDFIFGFRCLFILMIPYYSFFLSETVSVSILTILVKKPRVSACY